MKQVHTSLKLMMSGAVVAAAFASAGLSASAQTATTTTSTTLSTTTATTTTAVTKPTMASDQMVQEACQRQKARTAKFLQFGVPEKFGSEEPFVFDPKAPRC